MVLSEVVVRHKTGKVTVSFLLEKGPLNRSWHLKVTSIQQWMPKQAMETDLVMFGPHIANSVGFVVGNDLLEAGAVGT